MTGELLVIPVAVLMLTVPFKVQGTVPGAQGLPESTGVIVSGVVAGAAGREPEAALIVSQPAGPLTMDAVAVNGMGDALGCNTLTFRLVVMLAGLVTGVMPSVKVKLAPDGVVV